MTPTRSTDKALIGKNSHKIHNLLVDVKLDDLRVVQLEPWMDMCQQLMGLYQIYKGSGKITSPKQLLFGVALAEMMEIQVLEEVSNWFIPRRGFDAHPLVNGRPDFV